ncbi:hypothetical protein [Pseudomonas sp. GXZC]|uniref:hypothetical protein n=1 Tax=Pseudomonas sp. GXZC TaxID=3003351 RepID=UPI0022AA0283|nr:hypothetical protein [Pseudomonas sp. GXZC]WAT31795.1 hypothetical protein OZ428_16060 [Pseudomonas sp. GXZC]
MPNDPKWRTIARVSGQPVSLVQAVFLHLLVDASRNVTRGHVTVTTEDLASALDVTEEQIDNVFSAMQGRVLDQKCLTGWSQRQPLREDLGNPETGAQSATERKRAQRLRAKKVLPQAESQPVTQRHDASQQDSDTEEDQKLTPLSPPKRKTRLPDPFHLTGQMRQWAAERVPAVDLSLETERFVNYYRGHGKTMADWPATWRNWVLKAQGDANRHATGPPRGPPAPLPDFDDTTWAAEDIL